MSRPSRPISNSMDLRELGIWYPEVPNKSWYLNEESFWSIEPYTTRFQPLFWTHFGGEAGARLKDLTRIRADVDTSLQRLSFFYNYSSEPDESCTIGRQDFDAIFSVIDFDIDGPGGERIESVELFCFPFRQGYSPEKNDITKEGEFGTCKVREREPTSYGTLFTSC